MLSKSKRLFGEAKKLIPSGVNSPVRYFEPYPFFVKKSSGSHIWDADGRQLIDYCNGYGALLLGHRRREIIDAVSRQLKIGTLYCAPTEDEIQLSRCIADNYPSVQKVRLVNTGGEATMTAIRMARGHTKKNKIVMFEGCYHGAHDSVLVKAGSGSAHRGTSASKGGLKGAPSQTLVARYNNIEDVENIISKNDDIAGVIIEPIPANMGLVLPEKGFLKSVRKITQQNGIPLIFDEVVTGFRVSMGGAQRHFGIRPDITTMAKALGNGFGIAAVGGKKQILDDLAPGGSIYQASTFAGNPIAVSAALASIKTMTRLQNKLYPKLERHCARLAGAIGDLAADLCIPHQINSISSMMQIFFSDRPVTDYASSTRADARKFKKMFSILLKNRVFVAPSQSEVVFLSDAHTRLDLDKTLDAYRLALKGARD